MKKLFTLLAFTACLATANWSCSDDYDDSELRREIENLKQELAQIKSQISSLQTIINAVDTDKFITKITKTDNGYTITFSGGDTITIENGEKGADAPVIGIDLFEGVYYWTIGGKGKWLTDASGNKIPVAGEDGISPELDVDAEGYWTVDGKRITGADGKPVEVQVGPKEEQTRLPQVRENQFKVQSVYLPEENAIDLFRPEAKLYFVSDITSLYLKNAGPNIQGAEKPDGSPWGVPKDWNITPNLRNQVNNTVGGWKDEQYEQYKGLIHFESQDWGGPGFENGKVWQTPTLQPGTYEFTVFYLRGNTADDQYIHLAAALGSELPDRADMETRALAWKHLLPSDQGRENSIRFTVTQAGPVSLGLVVTISRDSQYLQFPYFKLSQIPEEE